MRKQLMVAAATALMGLVSGDAGAQGFTINATYRSYRDISALDAPVTARNGATGGGFAYRTTTPNPFNLTDFTAYCIGPDQYLQYPLDYRVLTFSEFVGWLSRPTTYDQIDLQNLNDMAALASLYTPGPATVGNGDIQEKLWKIARDDDNAIGPQTSSDFSGAWAVMVDERFFARSPIAFADAAQPMLVQIPGGGVVTPEPSTYALMIAGLAGIAMAARRRRVS